MSFVYVTERYQRPRWRNAVGDSVEATAALRSLPMPVRSAPPTYCQRSRSKDWYRSTREKKRPRAVA